MRRSTRASNKPRQTYREIPPDDPDVVCDDGAYDGDSVCHSNGKLDSTSESFTSDSDEGLLISGTKSETTRVVRDQSFTENKTKDKLGKDKKKLKKAQSTDKPINDHKAPRSECVHIMSEDEAHEHGATSQNHDDDHISGTESEVAHIIRERSFAANRLKEKIYKAKIKLEKAQSGETARTMGQPKRALHEAPPPPGPPLELPVLQPVTIIPVSNISKNLNAWNRVKDKLKVVVDLQPTQISATPTPIQHAPIYKNRDFRVLRILQKTVERIPVKAYGIRGDSTGVMVSCWVIVIIDANDPEACQQELYSKPPWSKAQGHRAGVLDTRICPTHADSMRVGQYACHILNRAPGSLNSTHATNTSPTSLRRMIETLALSETSPHFNHASLDDSWVSSTKFGNCYSWAMIEILPRSNRLGKAKWSPGSWHFEASVFNAVGERSMISVPMDSLDPARIDALPSPPSWFYYQARTYQDKTVTLRQLNCSTADFNRVKAVVRYIQWQLWGHLGSKRAFTISIRCIMESLHKPNTSSVMTLSGFCNDKPGWRISTNTTSVASYILPLHVVRQAITGAELPPITIINRSRIALSFVEQSMYNSWAPGNGILNAWQAGCVAGDIVNGYMPELVSTSVILSTHCSCKTDDDRENNSHYCMYDLKLFRCRDLVRLPDGRLVCQACCLNPNSLFDNVGLSVLPHRVRNSAYQTTNREAQVLSLPFDEALYRRVHNAVKNDVVDVRSGVWKDGYYGDRSIADAYYKDIPLFTFSNSIDRPKTIRHYIQPSLEAVRPLILENGVISYHHEKNVILTAFCLNALKGDNPASCLPWFRLARENIMFRHDDSFMPAFNNAMDHCMIISRCSPRSLKDRLTKFRVTDEQFQELAAMWRSGRWNGCFIEIAFSVPYPHQSHSTQSFHRKIVPTELVSMDYMTLSSSQSERILSICEEFRITSRTNPHGRSIPCGTDGAPWPWREEHLPENWSMKHLYNLFVNRFHVLKAGCNKDHDTVDSPETLLDDCIIWWYATGGKDATFDCQLVIVSRHPCRYSIGRHPDVEPGSPMRTGFTVLEPTSLKDYDFTRSTIAHESWAANRFKMETPSSEIPNLMDQLLGIKLETPFYDSPDFTLCQIPFPKTYKPTSTLPGTRVTCLDNDMFFSDGEDDEDEEYSLNNKDNEEVEIDPADVRYDLLADRPDDDRDDIFNAVDSGMHDPSGTLKDNPSGHSHVAKTTQKTRTELGTKHASLSDVHNDTNPSRPNKRARIQHDVGTTSGLPSLSDTTAHYQPGSVSPLVMENSQLDPVAFFEDGVGKDCYIWGWYVCLQYPTGSTWYGFPCKDCTFRHSRTGEVVGYWNQNGHVTDSDGVEVGIFIFGDDS